MTTVWLHIYLSLLQEIKVSQIAVTVLSLKKEFKSCKKARAICLYWMYYLGVKVRSYVDGALERMRA